METVKSTKKITEATKLVAAAMVRKAEEAVINVKKVALVVITGDRGLCGSFNNAMVKKADSRFLELKGLGLDYTVISVGKKGNSYFRWKTDNLVDRFVGGRFPTEKEAQMIADDVFSLLVTKEVDTVELVFVEGGGFPTAKEAQMIADDVFSLLVTEEVDTVELVYTKRGFLCEWELIDAVEDELFMLTTKGGKLVVERDKGIAARMNAMSNATDNAIESRKNLSIVAGAEAPT
ncbi:hypothetical protein V6N13_117805 [Hibiscus sabdariffa]